MGDRETMPINHSSGSHVLHTAGGAAGGAIKGGLVGIGVSWALGAGSRSGCRWYLSLRCGSCYCCNFRYRLPSAGLTTAAIAGGSAP
jgi:hypothetical protein